MTVYNLIAWIFAAIIGGLAAGRLVNHLIHSHRQKEAINRILWQEAAERAQLTADVRRIAVSLERIGLYLHGEL